MVAEPGRGLVTSIVLLLNVIAVSASAVTRLAHLRKIAVQVAEPIFKAMGLIAAG
jgi:hypothetical protein